MDTEALKQNENILEVKHKEKIVSLITSRTNENAKVEINTKSAITVDCVLKFVKI